MRIKRLTEKSKLKRKMVPFRWVRKFKGFGWHVCVNLKGKTTQAYNRLMMERYAG